MHSRTIARILKKWPQIDYAAAVADYERRAATGAGPGAIAVEWYERMPQPPEPYRESGAIRRGSDVAMDATSALELALQIAPPDATDQDLDTLTVSLMLDGDVEQALEHLRSRQRQHTP